jgi:hypothetical protein
MESPMFGIGIPELMIMLVMSAVFWGGLAWGVVAFLKMRENQSELMDRVAALEEARGGNRKPAI